MEKCRICGNPIERKWRKVDINGIEYDDVCESCSVCVFNIRHADIVSEETVISCKRKLEKICDESQTSEEIISWIEDLLASEKFVDDNTKVDSVGMQRQQFEKTKLSISEGEIHGQTFWASKIRIISICEVILNVIIGCIIAISFDDDLLLVGALVGGITGAITFVINMFIVEVAENIASCVNLLSKIASRE